MPRSELMPNKCTPTEVVGDAICGGDRVCEVCRCTMQWPSQVVRGIAEMDVAEVDHAGYTTSVYQHMLRSEIAMDDRICWEFPYGIEDRQRRTPLRDWNQRHHIGPETADRRDPAASGFRRRRQPMPGRYGRGSVVKCTEKISDRETVFDIRRHDRLTRHERMTHD